MKGVDLADFSAAVRLRAPGWEAAGIRWRFVTGPARDKTAAWVVCENAGREAQLTVWTSGEAELDTGDLTTGASSSTCYELATSEDLDDCLDKLTESLG